MSRSLSNADFDIPLIRGILVQVDYGYAHERVPQLHGPLATHERIERCITSY